MAPIVALHDELVGAGDQRQPVAVVERLGDVLSERVACAARGYAPSASVHTNSHLFINHFCIDQCNDIN